MRKPVVMLTVIMILALSVAWAGGVKGEKDAATEAAKMKDKLGLTDAQTQQLQALIEQTHSRWTELKANQQDEAVLAEAKKKLKSEYMYRLKSILTADQFARYQKLAAEHEGTKQAKKQPQ